MKTTPNHGLSYVEGNDKPADYPLISQENMTKLDTLIQQLIDGKASSSHNHSIGQIMGLTEALDAKADQQATATALAGKASSSHTHTMDGITGLTAALAAKANQAAVDTALAQKANTSHTHTQGDITGLTAALAGKAPTTHTHTMGQVTGLDTALAAKANQATLDTRVPSALALRVDTTVGIRIFAGTTMIYGDTGWRDVTDLFSAGLAADNSGRVLIRRTLTTLYVRLESLKIAPGTGILDMATLPAGSGWTSSLRTHTLSASRSNSGTSIQAISFDPSGFVWWLYELNSGVPTTTRPSVPILGALSMQTSSGWPATLIGTPA